MRASIKCDGLFSWGNTQSAHCLQFHPDWWHAVGTTGGMQGRWGWRPRLKHCCF